MNNRMFDRDSFKELEGTDCLRSAHYFAHNETKFRHELELEGLSYEEVQAEVAAIWTDIIAACDKSKCVDYIITAKKKLYSTKK